jgi:transcriptional regulator of heat shock response
LIGLAEWSATRSVRRREPIPHKSSEHSSAPRITIGGEHGEPKLSTLTLVTSEYRIGNLSGVLGVIGPTRMPYAKVAAIVEYTSNLMTELAGPAGGETNA